MSLMSCNTDINAAAIYVQAAAVRTFFAPASSSGERVCVCSKSFNARELALISTGNVTRWKTSAPVKSMIPRFTSNELAINSPMKNRGIDALEQIFTTGTIEFLKIRGEYASWCWIA